MSHPAYKPPPAVCSKAKVAKRGGGGGGGGVFAGHYGTKTYKPLDSVKLREKEERNQI